MQRVRIVSVFAVATLATLLLACPPPEEIPIEPEPVVDREAEKGAIRSVAEGLVAAFNARDYEGFRAGLTDDWTNYSAEGEKQDFDAWREDVERYAEVELELNDLRVWLSEDVTLAWATARGELRGEIDGQAAEEKGLYTALYKPTDEGWKLRHLHASSRAVEEKDEDEE